ncbi:hypothetical protein D3C84_819020 [compost metagenome]
MQGAVAALDDRLNNRQAQATPGALAVAPETLGQVLQIFVGNTRAMVAHHKLHVVVGGFQTQLHGTVTGGMTQGIVQQVAQRRDGQHGRHLHRGVRDLRRHLESDSLAVTAGGVLNGQFRHLLSAALRTIVERQTALDPRQQQ